MIRMLRADLKRLWKSAALRLSLIGMLVLASAFMAIQATSMDYTVPLSRGDIPADEHVWRIHGCFGQCICGDGFQRWLHTQ